METFRGEHDPKPLNRYEIELLERLAKTIKEELLSAGPPVAALTHAAGAPSPAITGTQQRLTIGAATTLTLVTGIKVAGVLSSCEGGTLNLAAPNGDVIRAKPLQVRTADQ